MSEGLDPRQAAPAPNAPQGEPQPLQPSAAEERVAADQAEPPAAAAGTAGDAAPAAPDVFGPRLEALEAALHLLLERVSYIPPQLRQVAGKVENVATALGESRYRALLLGLLGLYDLAEQAARAERLAPEAGPPREPCSACALLRVQLRQLLELNGLAEIAAEGVFDPKLHRALERVPVDDSAEIGRIQRKLRPGFRSESAILRFAEVAVGVARAADERRTAGEVVAGGGSAGGAGETR